MSIIWAIVFLSIGTLFGVLLMAALVAGSDADKQVEAAKARLIHRLQEMEYAIDGGNSAREDVPASIISDWFRYVWTGETQQ